MSNARTVPIMNNWSIQDTLDLYNIQNWGGGHFGISPDGQLVVTPEGQDGPKFALKTLADDLRDRGIQLPILVRCTDLLRARIDELHRCFHGAIKEYGYQGQYRGVYPIKVNQQRHVVEEILRFGQPYHYGLEAGSKPELLAVIAILDDPEALILCNGHKDEEYIEVALQASRIGRKVILVLEKPGELPTILKVSKRLGVKPLIGFRAKLSARGAGRWQESSGDRSKFGLTATDMLEAIQLLKESDLLSSLVLIHFHLGSQITDIRQIKVALREACRYYTELHAEGAPMGYLDVGGGLGVDYDGSRTNFKASINYTMQEYANDVVSAIQEMCDHARLPHPTIISESGRAITAHHAVLMFEVMSANRQDEPDAPPPVPDDAPPVIRSLAETYQAVSRKNFQESFHDVMQARDEVGTLFNHGIIGLRWRSLAERYAWASLRKIQPYTREMEYVPDELGGLDRILADTYFCNLSIFQSMPDSWAIGQLFPIVPIHRLTEEPKRRGVIADITCDSDGKIDKFIDLRDVKDVLELHELKNGEDYILGAFLVGAYQEILGDLHNLFGDINAVHVQVTGDGGYVLDNVVEGDTVSEVLRYVEFGPEVLLERMRRAVEASVRRGELSFKESKQFLELYRQGLDGYTYLEN